MLTICLFKGTIDSEVFYQWVKQDLLPKLPDKCVVVMDNASIHKRQDIQDAITNKKHILKYMPAYSPDLNPIEKKWAQAKAIRREKKCTPFDLFKYHVS